MGSPFGNRDFYHGDFLLRAAAALAGIYGNDAEEAVYPLRKLTALAPRLTVASTITR